MSTKPDLTSGLDKLIAAHGVTAVLCAVQQHCASVTLDEETPVMVVAAHEAADEGLCALLAKLDGAVVRI